MRLGADFIGARGSFTLTQMREHVARRFDVEGKFVFAFDLTKHDRGGIVEQADEQIVPAAMRHADDGRLGALESELPKGEIEEGQHALGALATVPFQGRKFRLEELIERLQAKRITAQSSASVVSIDRIIHGRMTSDLIRRRQWVDDIPRGN